MEGRLAIRQAQAVILCTAIACSLLNAQNKANSSGNSRVADEYPDLVELDPFGGCSFFGQVNKGLGEKLANGGTAGGRATWNFSKYVGLELGYNFMVNNVRLITPISPGLPSYTFGNQIQYVALNPVFNLTPRGSRVQPYLTIGVGAAQFNPTSAAERHARLPAVNAVYHSGNLDDNLQVALNYGGGIKFHLSEHFGLRFDARGFWSRNPTFDLPNYNDGGIYIVAKQHINGFQGTMGLVLYLGHRAPPPPPPACQAPAPLPAPTISGAEGNICLGQPVTLHAHAEAPAGDTLTYAWTVNGQAQAATGPDLTFTPNNAGSFNVQVTVTDATPVPQTPPGCAPPAGPRAPVTASSTVTVGESTLAISSISANPPTLTCRQPNPPNAGPYTAQLSVNASAGACGGNLSYRWTVSEGSLANDTSSTATFDTATLNFTNSGTQPQSKTVTATVTVTDQTGKTVTQSTPITVNCGPVPYVRLDDIVFAKNSARVNNCGRRVLVDDVARQLTGDYDVILVGHRDTDERANLPGRARRTRGRQNAEAGQPLDEARTLNAAAVLTGGTGRCSSIDLSRVKVDWVGTDQTSEPRPASCATSNVKERRGAKVTDSDKNRRVEVYLVPRGGAMPAAVKQIKPLPEREVKALGCPR